MSPQLEIARYRTRMAHESLEEADLLMTASRWRGALNRLYYAAFYAARAVLATRDLDSARHSGVIALFQQHFVKPGPIPTHEASALARAFQLRVKGDYADAVAPAEETVRELRTDIVALLAVCERVVADAAGERLA